MRRLPVSALVLAAALLGGGGSPGTMTPGRLFSVSVPRDMVTGLVEVVALARDDDVRAVKWTVDDWSRVTPPPFRLSFDTGPVPYERRILAVALDRDRRSLYRSEAILNRGGRGLVLEFRSPVDGQRASGSVQVEIQALTPGDDEVASVSLEAAGRPVPLSTAGAGIFQGRCEIPPEPVAFISRLVTRQGRESERTVVVNASGIAATAEAHVIDQLISVSKGGRPVEGLGPSDFEIRDDRGQCEVREAKLLTDAPLAIGFAIDTSVSLHHTAELRRATADVFVERCFDPKDAAFVLAFGPVVTMPLRWTRSKERLREALLSMQDYSVSGTALFAGVQQAVYQFQGSFGARALILVTDGFDHDGDVPEEAALAYARQSGIRLFAIGLTSSASQVTYVRRKGLEGEPDVVEEKREDVVLSPNAELLERFAEACGGQAYHVTDARDLPRIFHAIERDLRTQYLVSYVSAAPRRGVFHPVETKCRKGKVRTTAGFFY